MKILLMMNQHSYAGREYLSGLKNEEIKVNVISLGTFPEKDKVEDDRCGGKWQPEKQINLEKFHNFHHFNSLKSDEVNDFLIKNQFDLGIQGGTGIISKKIIDKFKLGIINFHPGLLPFYRGCSAPEWQIYDGNPVYCTCHFIDEGIDTGKIISTKKLNTKRINYENFRASIYIEITKFLTQIVQEIIINQGLKLVPIDQDENLAVYRNFIGLDKIDFLKKNYFNNYHDLKTK